MRSVTFHDRPSSLKPFDAEVLIAYVLAFIILLAGSPASAATKAEVYGHSKAATVLVVAIDDKSKSVSIGSGFIVNDDGLVITNAHVLEDSSRVFVYVGTQEVYTNAVTLVVDPDRDLAALRIPPTTGPSLILAAQAPPDGNEVMAIGYPRLTDILNMGFALHPTIVPGYINGIIQGRSRTKNRFAPFVQVTGHINQGSSGGPLVDVPSGEVIGMVVLQVPYLERARDRSGAGIGSVMIRSGIGYAIPTSVIHQWLGENQLVAEGQAPLPSEVRTGELLPSAGRSFATGHVLFTIAQILPKDVDLYNLAVYHYEAALELLPNDVRTLRHIGVAYAALGRFDDAIEAMTEAFEQEPNSAMLAYELGLAQEAKGLPAQALATWGSFLEHWKSLPDVEGWQVKIREAVVRTKTPLAAVVPVPVAVQVSVPAR